MNIKTFMVFLIHRVGAPITDISTCVFKRGIYQRKLVHLLVFRTVFFLEINFKFTVSAKQEKTKKNLGFQIPD